ncbi:MAG: rRNA maturation RNase YbeY [Dethiosulfovibrio peptidovorans]|nr:MAG: rRNA maturation RNase YbeY [Dethiosulfovibrio peptidovorans]
MKLEIGISSDEGDPRSYPVLDEELLLSELPSLLDEVWPQWTDRNSVSLSIATVNTDSIRGLNRTYRGIDAPTDVLSFPQWEENGHFEPPNAWNDLPLGDVVICPAVVRVNARAHGTSFDSELALMVVHGLLHLLGWDHDTDERKAQMWCFQERYRERLMDRLCREEMPS